MFELLEHRQESWKEGCDGGILIPGGFVFLQTISQGAHVAKALFLLGAWLNTMPVGRELPNAATRSYSSSVFFWSVISRGNSENLTRRLPRDRPKNAERPVQSDRRGTCNPFPIPCRY